MISRVCHQGLLTVIAVLVFGVAALGQCSNATLIGKYGFALSGFAKNAQPISFEGYFKADGKGKFAGKENGSVGGIIVTNIPVTGTYSINSDCTGSAITQVNKAVNHFNLVVVSGGKSVQAVGADTGNVEIETVQAQGKANCTLAGIAGTFGIQASGLFLGVGSVAFDGVFTLDGKGNVNGVESGSLDGAVFTRQPLSGTYTIASNCTGTMTTKIGSQTEHSSFFITNGGKGILLTETDKDTVVTGIGQQ